MTPTVTEAIREILGNPSFYDAVTDTVNVGGMIEYIAGATILCIVVLSVFRLIGKAVA
jgi:hypothetical protein